MYLTQHFEGKEGNVRIRAQLPITDGTKKTLCTPSWITCDEGRQGHSDICLNGIAFPHSLFHLLKLSSFIYVGTEEDLSGIYF